MNILLVDDEPGVTRALELNLKREGWKILTADSGPAALKLLKRNSDIEILASDFNMPGMDGAELINQALAVKPGLYTIVFTGWENRDYAVRSLRVGADDFIDKEQEFSTKIAQAIRRGSQQVAIARMGRKLLELEDKKDVLNLVFQTLRDLKRFDGFCLATRRTEGETCRIERAIDLRNGQELPSHRSLSSDSAYRYVIDYGMVFFPPVFENRGKQPAFEESQSIVVVPLPGEDSALGIEHREANKFKIDDLRFLQTLAQWVSLAFANIRTLRERRQMEAEQGLLAHALLHEINNPLNNIAMLAQGGHELTTKDIEDLIANVNRVRRVLRARLERRLQPEQEPQQVCLDETLEETISRFRDYYPQSGIEITYESSSPIPAILGDREMLITSFMNLLQNGAEATGGCGKLTIQAYFVPLRQQVELAFTDDGPGIPPDTLRRIFDYGYTTGGEEHSGQGLALTQEFVQRHGGEITVTSCEGSGTTFRVVFPIRAMKDPATLSTGVLEA